MPNTKRKKDLNVDKNLEEKNIGQSKKSKNGHKLNKLAESTYVDLNKIIYNFKFIMSELRLTEEDCGEYKSSASCSMDQFCIYVSNVQKSVLVLLTDNTTTARDRNNIKAQHGQEILFFKDKIVDMIKNLCPQYSSYNFFLLNGLVFPEKLITKYKNPEEEETKINISCANINYCTGILHSVGTYKGLDFGVRLNELCECIQYLDTHPEIIIDESCIRNIWITLNKNNFSKRPFAALNKNSIIKNSEFVKYCLEKHPSRYRADVVIESVKELGIPSKKNITKKKAIELILEYIENQDC